MSSTWAPSEIQSVIEFAAAGLGLDAISKELKRSKSDIRALAAAMRIDVEELEVPLVCPRCGYGYVVGSDDWCTRCMHEFRREKWQKAIDEEVEKYQEAEREYGALRQKKSRASREE